MQHFTGHMTLINTHILILGRAKVTNFEQQVKILEKSPEETFLMFFQNFFKGFDYINRKLVLQKYLLVTNVSSQASEY